MDSDIRRRLLWVQLCQRTGNAGLVCRRFGVSRPTLRKWIRRFHEAGEAGLLSHSRRPVRSPNRRVFEKERRLILSLRTERKLGARRIQNELRCHHDLRLSLDSIHKTLVSSQDAPLARPARQKTRHRYVRLIPGDRVQLDTCKMAPGCYQYTAVDDCTRYRVLAVFRRRTVAGPIQLERT
ncbi:MAG: helix-turn-helix domain containing protein [Nitrospira sp.]|nr:helix-turn-helix domain containing protein [Nitrospira sp.]